MSKVKIIQIIESCEEFYWKGISHKTNQGLIGLGSNGYIYALRKEHGKSYWEKIHINCIENKVKIIQIIMSCHEHYIGSVFSSDLVGLGNDGCIYALKEYNWEKIEISEEEFEFGDEND
jgi:3-dehydroquinate dehydratase